MASSESNKKTKTPELNQDLISNLPSDLTDEILKRLPLSMAAKMSVLSRKWKHTWLSLKYLVFDRDFWDLSHSSECFDWQKISNIIGNILLHHTGPVHEFFLVVPDDPQDIILNLSPWLSFLSRAGIKKITLNYWVDEDLGPNIPSHIFECNELVSLKIDFCVINAPPSEFMGFVYLQNLELLFVEFKHGVFRSLISSCPRLTALRLEHCTGLTNLDFEHMPILENLVIEGCFELLPFTNVFHLSSISLDFSWYSMKKASCVQRLETVSSLSTIKTLAMPPVKLQYLHFDGNLCKFLAAGFNNKITLTFNHLQKLCLTQLNLDDFDVFCSIIGMVQNCPFIKDLELSINQMKKSDIQHKVVYDNDYKLRHLLKAKITGITGSSVELKLIEYVFGISVVLEKLLFKCHKLDPCSELKVLRELLQLPRASTKAKLVCLAQ